MSWIHDRTIGATSNCPFCGEAVCRKGWHTQLGAKIGQGFSNQLTDKEISEMMKPLPTVRLEPLVKSFSLRDVIEAFDRGLMDLETAKKAVEALLQTVVVAP